MATIGGLRCRTDRTPSIDAVVVPDAEGSPTTTSARDQRSSTHFQTKELLVATASPMNHPLMTSMLVAIARLTRQPDLFIPYAPSVWFQAKPTPRHRARWSRTLRRLVAAGMLCCQTDSSRNRVRRVSITLSGWNWLLENGGAGALLSSEELLQLPGQWTGDLEGLVMLND